MLCGRHRLLAVADPLAEHECADQRGDAGVDVHHGAAGKIDGTPLEGKTGVVLHGGQCRLGSGLGFAGRLRDLFGSIADGVRAGPVPDHVRHGEVDEGHPQGNEQHQGGELHALGKTADNQCGGDAGKGHLEADVDKLRNDDAVRERGRHRVGCDAHQEGLRQAADEAIEGARSKGQAVAVDHPDQYHHADDCEHLHQHRYDVLGAHQTRIEQGEAGDRHQEHQHARNHHPRRIALVGCGRGLRQCRVREHKGERGQCRNQQVSRRKSQHGLFPVRADSQVPRASRIGG